MAPKKQKSKVQFEEASKKSEEAVDKVSAEAATEKEVEAETGKEINENVDSKQDTEATVTTTETAKKRYGGARGVSSMYKVVVKKAQGKKLKVQCNAHGVPVGSTRHNLQSYTGMLARTMIPIDIPNWSRVPNELKEKLWLDVKV